MNLSQFNRQEILLGKESTSILAGKSVIIFGLGGVGSYAAEAIARAGVGRITLVDIDSVSLTNLNRQLCALHSTIGKNKTEVVAARIADINPGCSVTCVNGFYLPENAEDYHLDAYDYVIDAIDTVSAKLDIAERCFKGNIPLISCMGTGNKLDPSRFSVSDIFKTSVCPLCKVMRTELRKRGVKKLSVVWSDEEPLKPSDSGEETSKRSVPGSVSFVPGTAGLICASKVIKDLLDI